MCVCVVCMLEFVLLASVYFVGCVVRFCCVVWCVCGVNECCVWCVLFLFVWCLVSVCGECVCGWSLFELVMCVLCV